MIYPSDSFDETPQWSKDSDLPDVRWRIQQKEARIEEVALQLEFDRALRELGLNQGWKALVERLRSIEHDETERLRYTRMDGYELGRRQGMLAALRQMTRDKPMEQVDVDNAVAEIRLLQQQLAELRDLLK